MKRFEDFNMKSKKPWEVEGVEWREVRFTEVVEVLDRYRIPVKKKDRKPGPYPYCGANGVIDFVDGYTHDGEFLLLAEDGGFFGRGEQTAYIMKGKFWANNHVHVLKVKPNVNLRFLYHFSIFYDFTPHLRGATRPKLSQTGMRRIKIPLPFRNGKPDLETQKKIVEYIEANFSRIDKILKKKKKQLEQLDELWESVLEQAFKPREGEVWREIKFLDKINLVKGTKPKSSVKEEKEGTLPYLTTEYFREKIIKEYIPIEENKITLVNEGDLVIIADGSRSGELFFCDIKGVLVSTMAKFEFNESEINKKYLFWFLTTHFEHLNKSKYTATPHVNKNHLKNLKIPLPFCNNLPDIEKQKEIANYLDNVYEKIKVLKEKIQIQINLLEDMKESILDEVFNHKAK